MNDPIFLIAILPSDEIQEIVTSFKESALRKFKTGHALKSPPHITLLPPFQWSLKKIKTLQEALRNFSKKQSSFFIELKNWDHFDDRVIFIDVVINDDLLDLQYSLTQDLFENIALKKDNRPYHPHMTVAFRDLKHYIFPKAWAHFSNIDFYRKFEVTDLVLLRHNGEKWEVFKRFEFQ